MSAEIFGQLGSGQPEQEATLAQVALGRHRDRHEVILVEHADQRHHFRALECDLAGVPRFEHLGRALDRLDDHAHFGPDGLDVEGRVTLRVALERNALEVHE